MNDNILFYSHNCPYCVQCLELIEPYADKISFLAYVNIHECKNSIPNEIKRVPTLVIKGGESIKTGYDVYLWIDGLINILQTQQEPKVYTEKTTEQQQPEIINESNNHDNTLDSVWSASTLITNTDADSINYASIANNKTITETIDYSRVRNIENTEAKVTLSPDSIQDLRNSELDKIRPTPIRRIS